MYYVHLCIGSTYKQTWFTFSIPYKNETGTCRPWYWIWQLVVSRTNILSAILDRCATKFCRLHSFNEIKISVWTDKCSILMGCNSSFFLTNYSFLNILSKKYVQGFKDRWISVEYNVCFRTGYIFSDK